MSCYAKNCIEQYIKLWEYVIYTKYYEYIISYDIWFEIIMIVIFIFCVLTFLHLCIIALYKKIFSSSLKLPYCPLDIFIELCTDYRIFFFYIFLFTEFVHGNITIKINVVTLLSEGTPVDRLYLIRTLYKCI